MIAADRDELMEGPANNLRIRDRFSPCQNRPTSPCEMSGKQLRPKVGASDANSLCFAFRRLRPCIQWATKEEMEIHDFQTINAKDLAVFRPCVVGQCDVDCTE
jgi:hypothetical protein